MIRKMIALILALCMVPVAILAAPAERIVSCYYISTATLLVLRCGNRLTGIEKKAETRPPDGIESWDYPTPTSILGAWYVASLLHPDRISAELLTGTAAAFYGDVYGFTPTAEEMGIRLP